MIEPSANEPVHPSMTVDARIVPPENPLPESTDHHQPSQTPKREKSPRKFTYPSGSTALPGYTIKRGIGIGGFGEVYFAISDAGKEVALKRIQRNLDVEIRGVSQCLNLKHINLISLWDIRQDSEGESWVVMEYVPGESLRDVLERNPNGIPVDQARFWFEQILAGVAYLHDHGIVHRDLKPGNIFYDQDENVVKIGDYGLSKFISTSKRDGQTESVGTFHYMAPEIGKGIYGKEIDVYSLGIILCEILTGRVPFDGESGQEIIMKHLTSTPEIGFVEPRFRSVILKALSKDPSERFSSVAAMAEAIDWHPDSGALAKGTSFDQSGSVVKPLFVQNDASDSQKSLSPSSAPYLTSSPGAPAGKSEPIYIDEDGTADSADREIQLGEVRSHQVESSAGWSSNEDGSIRMSGLRTSGTGTPPDPPRPVVSDRKVPPVKNGKVVTSVAAIGTRSEPIASAVGKGYEKISAWWNGIGATPVKVILVAVLGLLVLANAQWLVPLCIVLGSCYTAYYLVRMCRGDQEQPVKHRDATVIRPFSRRECLRLVDQRLREQRLNHPFAEKLAELFGSLLVATIVVGISTLVALGFSGYSLDGSVATLSLFAWLASTTLIAFTGVIVLTKIFECTDGNQWSRRFVQMSTGLVVAVLSFFIHESFLIDAIPYSARISSTEQWAWIASGNTNMMRFITFFAGYFLLVRWWRVGDPLRSTQFSLIGMILHATLGVGVAWLTGFPVIWALIIGSTLSIALQMASTWVNSAEREQVRYEVLNGIS